MEEDIRRRTGLQYLLKSGPRQTRQEVAGIKGRHRPLVRLAQQTTISASQQVQDIKDDRFHG